MTRRYPVRPKTATMILASAMFLGAAVFMLWNAATTDRGLVINGLVHLGPSGARIFYGVLGAISLAFVVLAVFALIVYARHKPEVVVDEEGVTAPGPAWRLNATRTVRFADLANVIEQKVNGQQFVTLWPRHGEKVVIAKAHLPDGAYGEIMALFHERGALPRAVVRR